MFFQRFGDVCVVAVRGLDRVGVRFRGTVAGFAALNVILVGEDELRVARLFVLDRFFFVAALALFRAGKRTGGRVKIRGVARDGWTLRSLGTLLRITRARRNSDSSTQEEARVHVGARDLLSQRMLEASFRMIVKCHAIPRLSFIEHFAIQLTTAEQITFQLEY